MEQENTQATQPDFKRRQEEIRGVFPRFYANWTLEEMKRVRTLFIDGTRLEDISAQTGRTVKAVKMKLIGMGELHCPLGRDGMPWTFDEEERLQRFLLQGYELGQIARMMGRRKGDVRDQVITYSYNE